MSVGAGGDRQAGEGSGRFDPLRFSRRVHVDAVYFPAHAAEDAETHTPEVLAKEMFVLCGICDSSCEVKPATQR